MRNETVVTHLVNPWTHPVYTSACCGLQMSAENRVTYTISSLKRQVNPCENCLVQVLTDKLLDGKTGC